MRTNDTPPPDLVGRLKSIIDEALDVVFDVSDEPGSLALAAESAPMILELVRQAADCLIAIQDHYEARLANDDASTNSDHTSLDDIGALISSEVAIQEVLDLAFMALAQLRFARGRLETAIDSQNLLAMVTRADSALTRLRREFIQLEAAISDYENIEPPMRVWVNLELSLEIRRVYGNQRRAIAAVGVPADADMAGILAEFSKRFAKLGTNTVYASLRISDRVQFQTLGRRITTWLANDEERDLTAGRRIWSDLSTFCHLLVEVNKRQELVEHDRAVLSRVYHALYANVRPPTVISEELLEELHRLEGLDNELDGLIQYRTSRNPADWKAVLERLYGGGSSGYSSEVGVGFT